MSVSNEEHRKFERAQVAIAKVVRFKRDIYTLPYALECLYKYRLWQERHRWLHRLLFASVQLGFGAGMMVGIKIYLAMPDGTFREWQSAGILKYLYHSLGLLIGPESSNLLLAVIILMHQNVNVFDYYLHPFPRDYRQEFADLAKIGRQIMMYDSKFDERITEQVGRQVNLCFNRHMTVSEKITFMDVFHRKFSRFYLLCIQLSLGVIAGLLLPLLYYLTFLLPYNTVTLDISSLAAVFFVLWAYLPLLVFIGFGGGFSMFIVLFGMMLVYGATLSWGRFCATIRRIDACWRLTNSGPDYDDFDSKFIALYDHVRHGQRVHMNCLAVFQKINHCIVNMVFFVSFSLTVFSQVELIIELFANRLGATLQIIIMSAILIELNLILSPLLILLMASKRLYSVNGLLLSYQTRFAQHRFRHRIRAFKTRAMLRWSLFVEIIHSRKRFDFRMNLGVGRINSMTVVRIVPIYTSFLFMLIPYVVEK